MVDDKASHHHPRQNQGNPETEKYFPLLLQKAKRSYSCQKSQTQEQNMKSNTYENLFWIHYSLIQTRRAFMITDRN